MRSYVIDGSSFICSKVNLNGTKSIRIVTAPESKTIVLSNKFIDAKTNSNKFTEGLLRSRPLAVISSKQIYSIVFIFWTLS